MEITQHFGVTYSLESKLIFFFELLGSYSKNGDMVTYIIFFQKEVSASTLQEIKNIFLTLGYDAGSQLGVIPWGPLAISGDTSGCHNRGRVLLASRMWRPGMLPNTPLCKDGPTVKNYLAPKFNKPRLRIMKSTLNYKINFSCGCSPCSLWGPHSTRLWNKADLGWNPCFTTYQLCNLWQVG